MYTRNGLGRRGPKYGNRTTIVDGLKFDSKAEANRWFTLGLLLRAGHIRDLVRQKRYDFVVNGVRIGHYTADFEYFDLRTNRLVVEDVKSKATKTRDFPLRVKLMKALYGIDVSVELR